MQNPSAGLSPRVEGGVERPLRGRLLTWVQGQALRGPLHPGVFWRSLSPHSLRDVSKPRGHSTQPLVDCSLSSVLHTGAGPVPHFKGDIRTAPPSRNRMTDEIHNNRNVVKRKILPPTKFVMAVLDTAISCERQIRGSSPRMTLFGTHLTRHGRALT